MYSDHLKPKLPADDILYVIAVISNPWRYHSRHHLYNNFKQMVDKQPRCQLLTVELSYNTRQHTITKHNDPWAIQLQTESELWHKENLINIGIARLPSNWKYVAWIDADIEFTRPDWAEETMHMLQHFDVVQMWGDCMDLLPNYEFNQYHVSFMKCYMDYIHGRLEANAANSMDPYYATQSIYWHAGFAWAARRSAISDLGGLIDWSACGANDHHMALALIGRLKKSIHGGCSPAFKESMSEWEDRALKYLRKNVGYVPGSIRHHWHGAKKNRKYKDRWAILTETQYDPYVDLKRDWQGVYQLTDRRGELSVKLRDDLREYFRSRNEDSIDPFEGEQSVKPTMNVPMAATPIMAAAIRTVEHADLPVKSDE